MANTFYRKLSRNVGTVAATVGSYTVGSSTTSIIVGLTICNTTGAAVNATVSVNDGTNNYYLVSAAPIPGGGSLVVIGGDQKVVLQTNDSVKVVSDAATSLDVIMSIMEIT
jgi:hypothetical protein